MNAIKTTGLEYSYPDRTKALSGINFVAKRAEKIAVLGANGSGKTTLFFHFNGLFEPTGGEIKVFGKKIQGSNIDEIRRRVGLVFQNPDTQLFAHTVYEDIAFGPRNIGLSADDVRSRVSQVLNRFDIEDLAGKNPANLSGGQKKRVSIAGVVAMEPDVMVLDEPTSNMDARGVTDTMEILDELNHEGKTIIISTHDSDLAASWADRVYILNRGRVFRSGTPGHIFADEKLLLEAGMKHPVLVQTFREFHARGISKGEVPLSVLDFMESVDSPRVMDIRCAVAGCEISAGDEVRLRLEDGMLVANKGKCGVIGKAVFGANEGEDLAVKDVEAAIDQLSGNITVIKVPGITEGGSRAVDTEKVLGFINENNKSKIGAMGTSAKVLANKIGIKCDIEFDVIQSGILAALRGFDVTIFASGRMGERVIEKVREKGINCTSMML
ncbi:MAG: ATP-binding cassette domain-containing protein [Candidatus Methanoperedens sp.]|nr:ATP-binding cassette domain-containing protein [Candidatus Methanoperedens sp.]